MNDLLAESVRKQIQTHNPLWITELYNACQNKAYVFSQMVAIYKNIHHKNPTVFDNNEYKKQILNFIQPTQEIKTYDFYKCLEDTYHAIVMSNDTFLCFCHQSFWLHIKNQIIQTCCHDYDMLFHDCQAKYLFEDWLIEVDIDLTYLNQTQILLNIIQEINHMINFSNHPKILDYLSLIETECYESLHYQMIS